MLAGDIRVMRSKLLLGAGVPRVPRKTPRLSRHPGDLIVILLANDLGRIPNVVNSSGAVPGIRGRKATISVSYHDHRFLSDELKTVVHKIHFLLKFAHSRFSSSFSQ